MKDDLAYFMERMYSVTKIPKEYGHKDREEA